MMESPENLTILPDGASHTGVTGDLLSHVLAQIRLTGDQVFSRTLAKAEQLDLDERQAHIVVVTAGALHMESEDQAPVVIDAGDLVLLPRGPGGLRLVASHPHVAIVACRFWFDPDSLRGMIFALPQCIHIRHAQGAGWIDGMLPFLMIETSDAQPGAALMISRIIDLMVIRTLRSWVHEGHATGWLGGLSDARIARSLKAIHERPLQRWSINELAGKAGMSRSSFCERFAALVGRSPLRYQNEWRLGLARDLLARRDARVGEIGLRIGYESEAAFSRAYKQFFGHSPRVEYALANEPAKQP
ncbi:AraC family transcriptional regulator [Mesorhizobium sp. SARCC-RB16n]|uniref:AraC family transcriptional regulator n=1 Tax=Mesorhizobium sp. SARCC-RB16n TaxID=2116687 RepID=UPI00122EDA0F|nr:AraC family transcriptional regulator [Mesorhizobium sp. SARCC-RB16n]KAA3441679.1 AraC family transcriptional regulator [Mesorhizobium sp. SARCC-RB16n]